MEKKPGLCLPPLSKFLLHLLRNAGIGLVLLLIALYIGMWGYHHFEKMNWIDSFANAAMILSGMGPFGPMSTTPGKFFAGFYALFSGLMFIALMGIFLGPVLHRILHKFNLDK